MLYQLHSLLVLSAITFLPCASASVAGHARLHYPVRARDPKIFHDHAAQNAPGSRREAAGSVGMSMDDLQLLQIETTAFNGWMSAWFDSVNVTDTATSVAQLKQEYTAYQAWLYAWLDSAKGLNTSPPPPLPTAVPVGPSAVTSGSPAAPYPMAGGGGGSGSAGSSSNGCEFHQNPANSAPAGSAPVGSVKPISTGGVVPAPTNNSTGYTFNAQSSSNVAVYYGQSPTTGQTTLGTLCKDTNTDIVILAFLGTFFGPGGYPSVNFGPACGGQTQAMKDAGATGLLYCSALAADITTCQSMGKKIMLSLGGSTGNTSFPSDAKAKTFATQVWDLFGAGTGEKAGLRPFGPNVILDGFDIDNEDHSTKSVSTFVTSLRTNLNSDKSKTYYISAAPQCPRPDASIPLDAMQVMDFVFLQCYNNAAALCNIGQSGFAASFKAWSGDLSAKGKGPRLYVGAPACKDCAGSGYLDAAAMSTAVKAAKAQGLVNFGGVSLWDGSEALLNTLSGQKYTAVVKSALI